MKRLLLVAGLFMLLHWLHAAEDSAKTEYERFAGTWRFRSAEFEGKKEPVENFKEFRLILKGDRYTVKAGSLTFGGTYKVDVTKKPKHIDVTHTDGPQKGQIMKGIYELEADTYKVCMALPGKERPTDFTAGAGSERTLSVWRRNKK